MAASLAAADIVFLRELLREMGVGMDEPTVCCTTWTTRVLRRWRRIVRAASAAATSSVATS
eukprot:5176410-Prymnesium_polylepis.1